MENSLRSHLLYSVTLGRYLPNRRNETRKMRFTATLRVLLAVGILAATVGWPVSGQGQILQYPPCSKGCALSYKGYAGWNGSSVVTDNTRQGVNPYETQLRASTLGTSTFAFQNSVLVDGQVYAQPLFMSGLASTFVRSENGVFVATEHGSVYALDAFTLATIVTKSLLPSGDGPVPQAELPIEKGQPCANITYEVGITGTPVIDPTPPSANGDPVLFAVVKSKSGTLSYRQTIHAWDFGANTDVWFDVGNALGWTTGSATTNQYALMQNQRAGLALSHDSSGNAIIYIAWGSHCDSSQIPGQSGTYPYNGWVAAVKYNYSTSTFSLLGSATDEALATGKGGIWMAGAAPAIDDATGDVYLTTGNGDFSTTANPKHWGESIVRLNGTTLAVTGSYTPNDWSILNDGGSVNLPAPASKTVTITPDQDLGASGAVVMKPVGQTINSKGFEVVAAGKEGVAYVLDPTQMGSGLQAADTNDPCTTGGLQPLQCFQPITLSLNGTTVRDGSGSRVPPAFWGGAQASRGNFLYTAGSLDTELRYWQMDPNLKNGTFSTAIYATGLPPMHNGTNWFPYPGGSTLVTWNSSGSDADAILWVVDFSGYLSAKPSILLAYPALVSQNTVNQPTLKSDSTNGPIANKFTLPTVANGQVYIAGQGTSTQCTNAGFGTNCGMLARWSQ